MAAINIESEWKSLFPATRVSARTLFSSVMLDSLKCAAFVTLPTLVTQSCKCPFLWTTIKEISPENGPGNTPLFPSTHPSTNLPTDRVDPFLEISQFSVGRVAAQQLDLMESDATITPDKLTKNFPPPPKTKMTIFRIPQIFLTQARKIFRWPLSLVLLYRMDEHSSVPTRIATQPALITGKGCELFNESDENTPLAKRNHFGNRTNKHKKHRPKNT